MMTEQILKHFVCVLIYFRDRSDKGQSWARENKFWGHETPLQISEEGEHRFYLCLNWIILCRVIIINFSSCDLEAFVKTNRKRKMWLLLLEITVILVILRELLCVFIRNQAVYFKMFLFILHR